MTDTDNSQPATGNDKRAYVRARSRARRLAMQGLYQWQLTAQDVKDIMAQQRDSEEYAGADADHYRLLMQTAVAEHEQLDSQLATALDRPVVQLDPVEHAIFWCALVELNDCPQTPFRVVINEAVQLAKRFGATDGHKYVNGVLDKLAAARR